MTRNTSFRNKIVVLCVGILCITLTSFGALASKITAKAARIHAEQELLTQAQHTAAILDTRIESICTMLTGIAALPVMTDRKLLFRAKARSLEHISAAYKDFRRLSIADIGGVSYDGYGGTGHFDSLICKAAEKKQNYITEPAFTGTAPALADAEPVYTVSVPVYYHDIPTAVLCAEIAAQELSDSIHAVQIGKTGLGMVLGATGTIIAHPDFELVRRQKNILQDAATDSTLNDVVLFMQEALREEAGTGSFTFLELPYLSAFATMNTTGWTVLVQAPEAEYLFSHKQIMTTLIIMGLLHTAGAAVVITIILGIIIKQENKHQAG